MQYQIIIKGLCTSLVCRELFGVFVSMGKDLC